jgi:hypothetical protein
VPLKDVALCFALGEGTPIVAIEAASDCWLGLAAGFALFAVMGEVPIEALLRMSCLSLLVVAVTGALTAAWGLAAATAVALGASAGREGLAAPAPGPVPVPAPAGRAAAVGSYARPGYRSLDLHLRRVRVIATNAIKNPLRVREK